MEPHICIFRATKRSSSMMRMLCTKRCITFCINLKVKLSILAVRDSCPRYCSVSLSVKPVYLTRTSTRTYLSFSASVWLSHLCDSQPSPVRRSDNQHRPFVPCCWVHQRRSHSAPQVLTTRLLQLPLIRALTFPYWFIHIHQLSYWAIITSYSLILSYTLNTRMLSACCLCC